MVRVSADSVVVMPRTAAVTLPNSTALPSANNAPMRKLSAPGDATSNTPRKPTISAQARARPTFSLSQTTANSVANNGEAKLMATAPASGIRLKAMMIRLCAAACVRAAADVFAQARGAEHNEAGARQDQHGADDQRDEGAEEQHLGERITGHLPFRQRAGDREHHGRAPPCRGCRAGYGRRARRAGAGRAIGCHRRLGLWRNGPDWTSTGGEKRRAGVNCAWRAGNLPLPQPCVGALAAALAGPGGPPAACAARAIRAPARARRRRQRPHMQFERPMTFLR